MNEPELNELTLLNTLRDICEQLGVLSNHEKLSKELCELSAYFCELSDRAWSRLVLKSVMQIVNDRE